MNDDGTLTLSDVAEILDVHYMTVYRYVRTGVLPAHREGRNWLVQRTALDNYRSAGKTGASGTNDASTDWLERLGRRLVAGDQNGVLEVLEQCLAGGRDFPDLCVEIIAPAMRGLNEAGSMGPLDIGIEHRATVVMEEVLAVLGRRFAHRGVSRGVVLVAAAPEETHDFPVRLVGAVTRAAGFEVQNLGADLPPESLAKTALTVNRLVAIGISVTMSRHEEATRSAIVAIRRELDVPVFVGGAAIRDDATALALGADDWAPDARSFVQVLESRLKAR